MHTITADKNHGKVDDLQNGSIMIHEITMILTITPSDDSSLQLACT